MDSLNLGPTALNGFTSIFRGLLELMNLYGLYWEALRKLFSLLFGRYGRCIKARVQNAQSL